jgi:iron complex outermembrane recepter protein
MSSIMFNRLLASSATLALLVSGALLAAPPASAQQLAANDAGIETVVVTGTQFNPDVAPAKASLDTKEPQTIINSPYIQDSAPPQADYVTILSIVPSMTGGDPNGPGLSDGGAKNTLRGLPDGDFVMQYDGIPFGDTNGPTHHNISYFPASTIGSINVDRGPGNAGNLGAATYGGTIKMFSEVLGDDPEARGTFSYGSFDTVLVGLNGQSGDLDVLGTTAKVLVNFQGLQSNGALSLQNLDQKNALLKIEDQIAPNWTLTLFSDYSYLTEHLDDNNGLTPAQVEVFGKNFALQDTNPLLPTYQAYNYTTKATDMEYFRLNGEIAGGLKLDNTAYTYAYWNHTFSPNSQTQTLAQIDSGTSADNATITTLSGTKIPNNLLAYDKQNAYRVWGDILRVSQDYDFGGVSGQVRAGVWWEAQATHRYKYYFDDNLCAADNALPYIDVGVVAAAAACGAVKGSSPNGALGYAKDDEYSGWTQYQPFLEIDIKPTDDLTITPGVKYIHWDHSVNAPVEQGNTCGIDLACLPNNTLGENYKADFISRDALPFLQVNYKIESSWSVYAEYAKGIYVPDISSFEGSTATGTFPQPENTTNYQVGTVYYADNFTFDADVYYIPINNNYVSLPCTYDLQETCFVNNGSATYEGLEGEGTYALDNLFDVDLSGLSVFANGALNSSKAQGGLWEPNAPAYTLAGGLIYHQSKQGGWRFSLIDKLVGQQYSDTNNLKFYEMAAYNDLSATVGYAFSQFDLSLSADNLLNSRATTLITENTAGVAQTNPATSLDQYFFQAPISVMMTLRVHT